MNTETLLRRFLAPFGDIRRLDRILRHDGFLYATNRHVIVRAPDDAAIDANGEHMIGPQAAKMIRDKPFDSVNFSPMPALPTEMYNCNECDGTGEVESITECPTCGQDTKTGEKDPCDNCVDGKIFACDEVAIGNRLLWSKYAILLADIGVEVAIDDGEPLDPLMFRCVADGHQCVGLVMPLRPLAERTPRS